jgi:hypothetical protein
MDGNGIELFTKTGQLRPLDEIEPQLTDPAMRERFEAVRAAHAASEQADADVAAINIAIKDAMAEVADADNDLRKRWPARTFLDEWKAAKAARAAELTHG